MMQQTSARKILSALTALVLLFAALSTAALAADFPAEAEGVTYEDYQNMSGAEQGAFQKLFPDTNTFFAWLSKVMAEHEDNDVEIGADGSIDLDDIMGFAGSGTAADPYLIATASQLEKIREYSSAHFRLSANAAVSGSVSIPSGVTLDLGGKTLACGYLVGFNGSQIIDSSADKSGAVQCAKSGLTVSADNAQMPVWNGTDGYFFESFDIINTLGSASSGTYTFVFRPEFVTNEREALIGANGGEASGLSVKVLLTWDETDGSTGERSLVYKDEFVKQVYGENKAFYAYITNYENYVAKNLQIRVAVVSDLGIEAASEAKTVE